jgi:hypothetical protein
LDFLKNRYQILLKMWRNWYGTLNINEFNVLKEFMMFMNCVLLCLKYIWIPKTKGSFFSTFWVFLQVQIQFEGNHFGIWKEKHRTLWLQNSYFDKSFLKMKFLILKILQNLIFVYFLQKIQSNFILYFIML